MEVELDNVEKFKQRMYESGSALYVPYYFKKFCNNNVLMREYVEATPINNLQALKEMGLSPETAYAFVLS